MTLQSRAKTQQTNTQTGSDTTSLPVRGLIGRDFDLPFQYVIANPKNTTQENPIITTAELPRGRINVIWLGFPLGCSGLAGLQLWRGARQIFPLIEGDWFIANGVLLPVAFSELLDSEPYTIEIHTYNEDDTYSHTLTILIQMSGLSLTPSEKAVELVNMLQG